MSGTRARKPLEIRGKDGNVVGGMNGMLYDAVPAQRTGMPQGAMNGYPYVNGLAGRGAPSVRGGECASCPELLGPFLKLLS